MSDTDTDGLFASPSNSKSQSRDDLKDLSSAASGAAKTQNGEIHYDAEEAREAALRRELASVRSINEVVEGVVGSLDRAKANMEVHDKHYLLQVFGDIEAEFNQTVSRTVNSASTLLNTWIRILSQTEHNQRLTLNPSWQGASHDIADIESETVLKQQAAERRELEVQRRREAAARQADDEERKRPEGVSARGTRGTRGRGRASTRGTGGVGPGYVGVGGQGASQGMRRGAGPTPGRTGSAIGKGLGSSRGRGKGVP
ncbi:MAG: hypothetical protein M1827_002792 [Pycnora praestabilis]|nr:MAG: hypothetical protein M1827_002792 [Pycnora praestabilis]